MPIGTGGRDRAMAGTRREIADVQGAAGAGAETRTGLGMTRSADVAQPHQGAGLAADGLQPREEGGVGIELGWVFVAGLAEIGSAHNRHRHRHVDAGDIDALDPIQILPGRQQVAGLRAGRVEESSGGSGRRYPAHHRWRSLPS